jgi:hypothetical protein
MRKSLIVFGLFFSQISFVTPVNAQETTITVGIPNNSTAVSSASGAISGQTISTAQIDSVLRIVAPGTFGQNFTRDKANKIFSDVVNLRNGLTSSLTQTIASQPTIRRVNSVLVNASALNVKLSQKTNSVSGEIGSISTRISLISDVDGVKSIFCPSVNVTFDIRNIKAFGNYNYISGDVSDARVAYELVIISASCNGLLGGLFNPTSTARGRINSAIQDQINTQIAFVNMQRLFSLADFANGLRRFRTETPIALAANQAISIFQEIINDAAINTPGIVIDFNVRPAESLNSTNTITLYGSHSPATIDSISCENNIEGTIPANTSRIDFYIIRPVRGATWTYYTTLSGSPETYFNLSLSDLPANTGVTAVAINSSIGGLQSFPSNVVATKDPYRYNPNVEIGECGRGLPGPL